MVSPHQSSQLYEKFILVLEANYILYLVVMVVVIVNHNHHYLVVMVVVIVSHEGHYLVASEVSGNCQSRRSLTGS